MNGVMLGRMRGMAQRGWLTDRCTIERSQQTISELGTAQDHWLTISLNAPCRLVQAGQQAAGAIEMVGQQPAIEDLYKLALPHDADIQADDRITLAGVVYEVIRLDDALTDRFFKQALVCRYRGIDL